MPFSCAMTWICPVLSPPRDHLNVERLPPAHHGKAHAGEVLELVGLPPALALVPETNLKQGVPNEKKAQRGRSQSAASA
jgi:hypothetical protein